MDETGEVAAGRGTKAEEGAASSSPARSGTIPGGAMMGVRIIISAVPDGLCVGWVGCGPGPRVGSIESFAERERGERGGKLQICRDTDDDVLCRDGVDR